MKKYIKARTENIKKVKKKNKEKGVSQERGVRKGGTMKKKTITIKIDKDRIHEREN